MTSANNSDGAVCPGYAYIPGLISLGASFIIYIFGLVMLGRYLKEQSQEGSLSRRGNDMGRSLLEDGGGHAQTAPDGPYFWEAYARGYARAHLSGVWWVRLAIAFLWLTFVAFACTAWGIFVTLGTTGAEKVLGLMVALGMGMFSLLAPMYAFY